MTIGALIVAAGKGTRAGGEVPKQFANLNGQSVLFHSVKALSSHPMITTVHVVIAPGDAARAHIALGPLAERVELIPGGAERRHSVRAGLEALAATGVDAVLIHDAARPFLPASVIDALIAALDTAPGAVPALPLADTLARGGAQGAATLLGDTVPRDALYRIQTPQAFRLDAILAAHRAWPDDVVATDDTQMLRRMGQNIHLVAGDPMLEKITHPADFAAAEARFTANMISRSASGYDVHKLAVGEELWLGGVLIPHDKGLAGHSDADVGLHAITDALLGTICAGDIGMHFPPSDPQWRGASSDRFLAHAAQLVRAQGGIIDFIDLTLICEAPKIGPHRDVIRARIAEILDLPVTKVSLKATTTERLGFTGRGEGIAAQAVATIRLPDTP